MHASLASIGRACTVEDEEPPETPTHSSIDSQTDYLEQCFKPPGWTARELVEKTSELMSRSVEVWPYSVVTPLDHPKSGCAMECGNYVGAEESENTSDDTAIPLDKTTKITVESVSIESYSNVAIPPVAEVCLDRLTRLHRLCELVRHTFRLDCLTSTYSELNSGLSNLCTHSDNITLKEYELLEATLSDYSRAYSSPLPTHPGRSTRSEHHAMMMKHSALPGTASLHPSSPSSPGLATSASVYPYTHFSTPVASNPSQLGELRVICESLRQCLTQMKRFFHEQQNTARLLRNFPRDSIETKFSLLHSPTQTVTVDTNRLTSAILLSAHHLVYSGLSLLAHADITRYTHGELWEMTRGIEELDILNRHLQIACRTAHSDSLCDMLMEMQIVHKSTGSILSELSHFELLYDPVLVACSISVGYIFTLIAYQRSIRLANAIYQQLSAVRSFDLQDTREGSGFTTASVAQSKCLTLVEAFRVYLNQNYDRTASEYLRSEYEFIAGFLDVLSQSTNMLYQVQKLKLICSAAAAAQAKKTELDRQNQRSRFSKPAVVHESSSHAVSVEGVHGILVKRISTEKEPSYIGEGESKSANKTNCTYNRTSRCVRKESSSKKHSVSQYQETLHRAGTLDRYVATGSVNYPMSSNDPAENTDNKNGQESENVPPTVLTEQPNKTTSVGAKKAVQWSDHREISTRHQVIGRFLEMTWRYTEIHLLSLFMCPSTLYVTSEQTSNFYGPSVKEGAESETYVSGIGRRCTTVSCFLMKPHQIRTLSSYIREVSKPDLFPAGLVPALRRQALRLDELAHRRSWFTSMRSKGMSIGESMLAGEQLLNNNITPHAQKDGGKTRSVLSTVSEFQHPSASPQISDQNVRPLGDSSCEHRPRENCAVAYLESLKPKSSVCPNCLAPQSISSIVLHGELLTILRLNMEIFNHFSKDRSAVDRLVESVNVRLNIIDFPNLYKQTAAINAEQANQTDVLLQSAYDLSRRMNSSVHRFYLYIKSLIKQLTLRLTTGLDCTCSNTRNANEPPYLSKMQLVVTTVAQLFRIRELVAIIHYLSGATTDVIVKSYWHLHESHLPQLDGTNYSSSTFATYSDVKSAVSVSPEESHSTLSSLKIRLPNGIRIARILGVLKRLLGFLNRARTVISEAIGICTEHFAAHFFRNLFKSAGLSPTNKNLGVTCPFIWQIPDFVDSFIHSLMTIIRPCSLEVASFSLTCSGQGDQKPRDSEPRSVYCEFHHAVYNQIVRKLFAHFCLEWLSQTNKMAELQTTGELSNEHAKSVEKLRSLLLEYRHESSIELLTVICDCPEFQRLLSTTTSRSCGLVQKPADHELSESNHSVKGEIQLTSQAFQSVLECDLPLRQSPRGVSRHFPIVLTPRAMKDKFVSRLNAPGEALAAFAAGVKNSIFMPIRQLATTDTSTYNPPGTGIEPATSVEVLSSNAKSPSTGSEN